MRFWRGTPTITDRLIDVRRTLQSSLSDLRALGGPFVMTDVYTTLDEVVSGKINSLSPFDIQRVPAPMTREALNAPAALGNNLSIEAGELAKVRRAMGKYVDQKYRNVP